MRLMTPEQLESMRLQYASGRTMKDLAKIFDISPSTIRLYLKNLGVEIRSLSHVRQMYHINEDFFDTVDTQEKAYFLGLLYADGCNQPDKYRIRLGLQTADKALLERFRDAVFPEGRPLSCIRAHTDKAGRHRGEMWELRISNKHMSAVLEAHGMVARKTFVLAFPEWLRGDLIPHFIRGYNDGDGCIESAWKQQCRVELLGTWAFCQRAGEIATEVLGISVCFRKRKSISNLVLNGRHALRFLDWIYADSTIHLSRKHAKYMELKHLQAQRAQARFHRTCFICGKKHYAKGFCQFHYYRWRTNRSLS